MTLTIGDVPDEGIGPMVATPEIEALRTYDLGLPVSTGDQRFVCIDAFGECSEARLKTGNTPKIDTIARTAHAREWVPNVFRTLSSVFACPLVVGF